MDTFRKMYAEEMGCPIWGLDHWANQNLKENYREYFGFFCYKIVWNL